MMVMSSSPLVPSVKLGRAADHDNAARCGPSSRSLWPGIHEAAFIFCGPGSMNETDGIQDDRIAAGAADRVAAVSKDRSQKPTVSR